MTEPEIKDSIEDIESNDSDDSGLSLPTPSVNRKLAIGGIAAAVVVILLVWRARQQESTDQTSAETADRDESDEEATSQQSSADEDAEPIELPQNPDSELEKDSAIVKSDVFQFAGS
jgi:hypothetical protein